MKNPTQTDAWGQLSSLSKKFNHADFRLSDLFEKDTRIDIPCFTMTHWNIRIASFQFGYFIFDGDPGLLYSCFKRDEGPREYTGAAIHGNYSR